MITPLPGTPGRYPDASRELNRWLPLVKWFLAIGHYIVLFLLRIGVVLAVVIAWFAILFTGRYLRALFDHVEGVIGWHNRKSPTHSYSSPTRTRRSV